MGHERHLRSIGNLPSRRKCVHTELLPPPLHSHYTHRISAGNTSWFGDQMNLAHGAGWKFGLSVGWILLPYPHSSSPFTQCSHPLLSLLPRFHGISFCRVKGWTFSGSLHCTGPRANPRSPVREPDPGALANYSASAYPTGAEPLTHRCLPWILRGPFLKTYLLGLGS